MQQGTYHGNRLIKVNPGDDGTVESVQLCKMYSTATDLKCIKVELGSATVIKGIVDTMIKRENSQDGCYETVEVAR